jgi:hypothetical protein
MVEPYCKNLLFPYVRMRKKIEVKEVEESKERLI